MIPPPVKAAGTIAGGIHLTPEDLAQIAERSGLKITADADRLGEAARRIASVIETYILWSRVQRNHPKNADVVKWLGAVVRWASEGSVLIAGSEKPLERNWQHHRSAVGNLFTGGLPTDEEKLRPELYGAGLNIIGTPGQDYTQIPYQLTDDLVRRTTFMLGAIQRLGEGALKEIDKTRQRKRADHEKRQFFRQLGIEFEQLHPPQRFVVSNRHVNNTGPRDNQPRGPALDWCRSLFDLCAQRLQSTQSDLLPELGDLKRWATRSDALAERITEAQRTLRSRQKRAHVGR